jgi:ribosomal peptide maturation radical SAM protein 1
MVGWENYSALGQMTALFAGEQMFARALFGDHIPDDARYFADVVSKVPSDMGYRLQHMKTQVMPFLEHCIESIPWHKYDIIGFSSLFEQNTPSLTLAYQVKLHFPNKIIVFGGANCEDIMGLTLHKCFPFVDYVFAGEADDTFPEFVKRLSYGHPVHDLQGIVYRDNGTSIYTGDAPKMRDLDALPFPDYDDYYQRLQASSLPSWLSPYLVLETARGCWWGEKVQCTFCGLNGKYIKFRSKSPSRIIDEISHLIQRYRRYNIGFIRVVDNVLNPCYFDDVFPEIANMNLDVPLYFEVRPNLRKHQIKALAEAGVTNIQVGLENLSSHILKLMRKGTSSLQNIQFLKWCKQYGVRADWNIIFGFPGEVAEDYAQSLELANVLTHLNPPTVCGPLRLDRFSHNFNRASEVGFVKLRPANIYQYLYPFDQDTLFDLVYNFDFDYREKIDDGGFYYPLTQQVQLWKSRQDQMQAQSVDGQLVIRDTRPVAVSARIVLDGVRKHIYEYCDQIRSANQIQQWLKESHQVDLSEDQIEMILDEYVEKKLMVREKKLFLSLAIYHQG